MLNNVALKTLRDRRRSLTWWVIGIFGYLLGIGAFYPIVSENQNQFEAVLDAYPEELLAIMGVAERENLFDPVGFIQAEALGWIVPLVFAIYGAVQGARAVAGEEEDGTIDVVMATPLTRSGLVSQKLLALVLAEMVLGAALFLSIALDTLLFDLDIPLGNIAAAALMAVLLGVFFGSLALAVGSATGLRGPLRGGGQLRGGRVIPAQLPGHLGGGHEGSAAHLALLLLRLLPSASERPRPPARPGSGGPSGAPARRSPARRTQPRPGDRRAATADAAYATGGRLSLCRTKETPLIRP